MYARAYIYSADAAKFGLNLSYALTYDAKPGAKARLEATVNLGAFKAPGAPEPTELAKGILKAVAERYGEQRIVMLTVFHGSQLITDARHGENVIAVRLQKNITWKGGA